MALNQPPDLPSSNALGVIALGRVKKQPLSLRALRIFIALVWLVMGLGCKVLGWEPRHEEIVARILGEDFAPTLIILIGLSEVGMALWIISGLYAKLCAWTQMVLVAVMNVMEITLTRDLLLFGWMNGLVAAAFIALIYATERLRARTCQDP